MAEPFRLAAGQREICALGPSRAFCIARHGIRKGEPGFSVRSGPPGTVEVVGTCHRNTENVVRCQGVEVARDVISIAAAPYLLHADGTVTAVDLDDDETHAETYRARAEVATALGSVKKIVYGPHAGCALRLDATVVCWIEPWTMTFRKKVLPAKIRSAPGLTDVVDLFRYSWLSLCALDRSGTVRCSAPPPVPTDACLRRGAGVHCGLARHAHGGKLSLLGPTFDPSGMLARPLQVVLDGVSTMLPFTNPAFEFLEVADEMGLSEVDPGGCATRGAAIVCWNRSPCDRRFTNTEVQGLPPGAKLAAVGSDHGYALGDDGALFSFPRRDVDPSSRGDASTCEDRAAYAPPSIHATRMAIGPVQQVAGGEVAVPEIPGYTAADCASLRDGTLRCWTSQRGKPLGEPVVVE